MSKTKPFGNKLSIIIDYNEDKVRVDFDHDYIWVFLKPDDYRILIYKDVLNNSVPRHTMEWLGNELFFKIRRYIKNIIFW